VLIQVALELTTTAPDASPWRIFRTSWEKHVVGYELPPCDTARTPGRSRAATRQFKWECLHVGLTIEYFTDSYRSRTNPDLPAPLRNQGPRHSHGLGIAQRRKTPPASPSSAEKECLRACPRWLLMDRLPVPQASHRTRRRSGLHEPRFRDQARPPSRHRHVDGKLIRAAVRHSATPPRVVSRHERRGTSNRRLRHAEGLPGPTVISETLRSFVPTGPDC